MSSASATATATVAAAKSMAEAHAEAHHIPAFAQFTTYLSYAVLMIIGYLRDSLHNFFFKAANKTGMAPLVRDWDDFFTRRMYYRIRDCWNRPVSTRAGRTIGVMERASDDHNVTFRYTGKIIPCINLASYNYLGFSEAVPAITEDVLRALDAYGVAACASPVEGGRTALLSQLEQETARFVGKEDAVVFAMGFATNFSGLPGMFDKGTLVISDSLNHASLVAGARVSDGRVKVFPHNNMEALEKIIRGAIVDGQPRTHRPWKRIVIVVEGIYSMEGEIIDLPAIVALKKKYRCLLYVDEAHSIGALGESGKGVCDYHHVNPADVDILMGTFTKAFASVGGYIASSRTVVNHLRRQCGATQIGDAMSSASAQQALSALRVMRGADGTNIGQQRIQRLADNSVYMRQKLKDMGLIVYGNGTSPVIPCMLYNPAKVAKFSRECLKRNVAVVVVGYPATPLLEARVRFCVSAAHTREDLDRCLAAIDEAAGEAMIRYKARWHFI